MDEIRAPIPKGVPSEDASKCGFETLLTINDNGLHFTGYFNGYNVAVRNQKDIDMLHNYGCFGKGSLSRSAPCYTKKEGDFPRILSEGQWKFRKEWEEMSAEQRDSTEKDFDREAKPVEYLVINNKEEDESKPITDILKPRIETAKTEVIQEELHLTLEEAFFLSFALGKLNVFNESEMMTLESMWIEFQKGNTEFISRYIAYHYFTVKGWVVKPGTKYGGDFLLYKQGPSMYHGTYVVLIRDNKGSSDVSLLQVQALNRLAGGTKKGLIICEIFKPSNFDNTRIADLSKCSVNEFVVERWQASTSRTT